ncbi:YpfB family protein [Heyndrickxia vini]|uniref:YpfB family protein n=1 Tax=Heyndrickxia vini TaxID=1476025 RepID=A0ABX7E6P7_9BACI|nr:YpfB family protein [Heyndrickxia vini]QQZ11010.1 YpfB family protein [Heyndrickxia vini]
MKTIERWFIKLIVIHFIFLLIIQVFLHNSRYFQDIQKITFYEGVSKINETPIVETWGHLKDSFNEGR